MSRSVSRRSSPSRPPIRPIPWASSSRSACRVRSSRCSACSPVPAAIERSWCSAATAARWRASSIVSAPGFSARKLPASSRRASRPSAERAASAGISSLRRSRPRRSISRSQELGRLEAVQLGLDDPVQRGEALDPLAGLGGDLGRFDRCAHPHHEVELAPAGDLDHAREVHLAKLHRRARERAGDRAGVLGIHEQPQPGDHVAHLRAPQKAVTGIPLARGSFAREPRRRRRDLQPRHSLTGYGPGGPAPASRSRPGS